MKPEDVGYLTMLDADFTSDLKAVATEDDFQKLLDKWDYWLDEETKALSGKDWKWMEPLVEDCRKESVIPEDRHQPAMALVMPARMFKVSIVAVELGVPWGCAYIRMKEEGAIDY